MLKEFSVNFSNLLLSLSDAIDLANPSIASHQMRTAFITLQLASSAGLPRERVENLFIASLFHDIGAMTLEEKINIHNANADDEESHCILSEEIFKLSYLFEPSKNIVRHHHKPWKLWNDPITHPDVYDAQLLYLADLVEKNIDRNQYILHQVDHLEGLIGNTAGDLIHPDIVKLFIVHLLLDNFDEISTGVKEKQILSRDVYEMKFSKINYLERKGFDYLNYLPLSSDVNN